MGTLDGFMWGVFGGFLSELPKTCNLLQQAPDLRPQWLKSPFHFLVTCAMIFAGGGLVTAYLQSDANFTPFLAVNIGASAPLMIGVLVNAAPPISPGKIN